MQQVILEVSDEVKALADALGLMVADIKAGKAAAAIVADCLPGLVAAVGGYAAAAADIKLVDNQIYLLRVLAQTLEAPAPAAPAA